MSNETTDRIIIEEIKWHYENFLREQEVPFISHDEETESKYAKKMAKAFKRVHNFYALPGDRIK